MSSLAPRIVIVTRRTELEHLMAQHATRGQAEFFLKNRGQTIDVLITRDESQSLTVQKARHFIPDDWVIATVNRRDLDRFLFSPNDIIIAIGQDGLVANLAKYLTGQPVIGISPDTTQTEAILTQYAVNILPKALRAIQHEDVSLERRTMVEARLDDGQTLLALNEVFLGHKSHQSAKYIITHEKVEEYQSSSGVIVATGTGITGWAKSILRSTHREISLGPDERQAVFFAREPWPSRTSGTKLNFGRIANPKTLNITSRMNSDGVIFADGIEQDFLKFNWGTKVSIRVAKNTLNLVSEL